MDQLSLQEVELWDTIQRDYEPDSLWGLAISNVAANPEPRRVRDLFAQLRSQAEDCKEIMHSIIGEPAVKKLGLC